MQWMPTNRPYLQNARFQPLNAKPARGFDSVWPQTFNSQASFQTSNFDISPIRLLFTFLMAAMSRSANRLSTSQSIRSTNVDTAKATVAAAEVKEEPEIQGNTWTAADADMPELVDNPKELSPGVYAYGNDPKQAIYVNLPPNAKPGEKLKTIVYVHGGAFIGGDPGQATKATQKYLAEGYAVINVGYRLASTTSAENSIEDIRQGITAGLNVMGDKAGEVIVSGGSAGATAASLLLFSEDYKSIPKHIDKFIGICGQYDGDFIAQSTVDSWKSLSFGQSMNYRDLIKYTDTPKNRIPTLMLMGTQDEFDGGQANGGQAQMKNLIGSDYVTSYYTSVYPGHNSSDLFLSDFTSDPAFQTLLSNFIKDPAHLN